MQLIFETEKTVNIAEKMTSVDTTPGAESKPDSPPDDIKISKCNSMEKNNIDEDVKADENGTAMELNGDDNDTKMTVDVNMDKENETSAQNGMGDIATTAEIATIDSVLKKDCKLTQKVPDEKLMQVEENSPEIPEIPEKTSNLLEAENRNDTEECTINSDANDVIQQEVVKDNCDKIKIIKELDIKENIALQPKVQNETTVAENQETKLENSDSVTTNCNTSEARQDNLILAVDTSEAELTETNPEEKTETANCTKEMFPLLDSIDDTIRSTECAKLDFNTTQQTLEDNVTTTVNALREKTEATDEIQDSIMESNDHEISIKASDKKVNDETNNEEQSKSRDQTGVNGTEVTCHNAEVTAIHKSPENKIEATENQEDITATDETELSKKEAINHEEEISNETQNTIIESTNNKEHIKATNETPDIEMEESNQERIKDANETQVNKMEVTDLEEGIKLTDETQESKEDKIEANGDELHENKKELCDQLNLSQEKDKPQLKESEVKQLDSNSKDSVLNENSDSLGSNACDESLSNSSKDVKSVEQFKENQIKSNDDSNISNNLNNETQPGNIKTCDSLNTDLNEKKADSPIQVEQIDLKAVASEAMDVDDTEDPTSDNPAVSNETKTTMDTVFDKLLAEEIISVNSGKTDNLDSDRKSSPVTVIDCDEDTTEEKLNNSSQKTENEQSKQNDNVSSKPKKTNSICGLSNTLDILSDDDDDCVEQSKEKLPEKPESKANDNKCINLDEDDDVMLIDDSPNQKEPEEPNITDYMKTTESESVNQKNEDDKHKSDQMNTINLDNDSEPETIKASTNDDVCKDTVADAPVDEELKIKAPEIGEKLEKPVASPKPVQRPILPENFLKVFRKNVVDMNRDELEEFCLMKIVEGIIDQTNLSEVKTKLKTMSSYVEEWKKKVTALTKQNRDLQIVLKTVQDEQKKRSEHQVVPLKITRSVGMQVYMAEVVDRNTAKRKAPATTPAARNNRNPPSRPSGKQNSATTPIPVPRLVPAPNNSPMKGRLPQQVQNATVTSNSPKQYLQNGMKAPSPVQKTEKRPFSSVQSVTVDLTDDEPPAKQPAPARSNPQQAPVRLVAQQQLMKPRAQVGINNTNARKVFIPINPQNNIRPGQTITLKSVPPNARIRGPGSQIHATPLRVQANAVRGPRPNSNVRHPAPLPEVAKQQQPPNWKALPPAPDLKISKVENGIVISWKIEGYQEDSYEEIASYQLYAYQETSSPPSTLLWKKIGDVKALPLPMACTLTQFMAGYKYYFAVRAVDIRSRIGTFSLPGSILLLNK